MGIVEGRRAFDGPVRCVQAVCSKSLEGKVILFYPVARRITMAYVTVGLFQIKL